jgi:hypothetical protein
MAAGGIACLIAWAMWPERPPPQHVPETREPVVAKKTKPTKRRRRAPKAVPRLPAPTVEAEPIAEPERVYCTLPDEVTDVASRGLIYAAQGLMARVEVDDEGRVSFPPPPDTERIDGALQMEGFARTTWSAERHEDLGWHCELGDFYTSATVVGQVRTKRGIETDSIMVVGCGRRTRVDRDGGFFLEVDPEPCRLMATRRDGMFFISSPTVKVEPASGEEVILDLDLPSWRASGIGVGLREHPEGIEITRVVPDSPAQSAGLRRGDIVVGIDDEDAATFSLQEFVNFALGPPGSDVSYVVLRDGEEVMFDLVRAPLGPKG